MKSFLKDGEIDDWNIFEEILDYSYDKIIKSQAEYHPVLFSEAPWNHVRTRKISDFSTKKPSIFWQMHCVAEKCPNGKPGLLMIIMHNS